MLPCQVSIQIFSQPMTGCASIAFGYPKASWGAPQNSARPYRLTISNKLRGEHTEQNTICCFCSMAKAYQKLAVFYCRSIIRVLRPLQWTARSGADVPFFNISSQLELWDRKKTEKDKKRSVSP